jgi:tetratricopeptide (TPR) repeat protein
MNLIEEALCKAKKEGKNYPEELAYEINSNNILSLPSPKKHHLFLGISIVSFLFILSFGLVWFFGGPEKLTHDTKKLLASNNMAPNPSSKPSRAFAAAPQKKEPQATSPQEVNSVSEERASVAFKNLTLELNGKTLTLKNGEHLKVKRGDSIVLKEIAVEGVSPKDVKVNFLGFEDTTDNTGEDRGYTINTASDLWEKYSLDGKGDTYTITIEKEGDRLGTIYVDLEESKTVLVKQKHVPKIDTPSVSQKQKDNIEPLLNKAFVYSQAGNYALARECYDKILSAHPQHFDALLNRGITRTKLDDLEGAERDLFKAYAINSRDPLLLNALGVFYLKIGDEAKAENFLSNTGDTTSKINLALYYWGKGENEKVISLLKQSEKQDLQDPYPSYYLGLFYRQLGENALAREKLDKALSLAQKRGLFDLIREIDSTTPGS